MAIIYTYPKISSLSSQDSFLITDVSNSNKTKTVAWQDVLKSEGLVQNKKLTLTAAEILDLHNTAIELVAAPGSGKFIHVVDLYAYLDFNSTAYITTPNSDIRARYGDGTTTVQYGTIFSTSSLAKTEDFYQAQPSWPSQDSNSSWLPNKNIELYCAQANSSGDSPINVYISYIIKDL